MQRYVYPVTLGPEELEALDAIEKKLRCSKAEAIRRAVQNYAEYVKGLEVIKLRRMSKKEAKKKILEYLEKNDHAWSSEIADALRLDISLVFEVLEELWREEKVEPTTQQA